MWLNMRNVAKQASALIRFPVYVQSSNTIHFCGTKKKTQKRVGLGIEVSQHQNLQHHKKSLTPSHERKNIKKINRYKILILFLKLNVHPENRCYCK